MQPQSQIRNIFYVSDGTAITAETIGHAVLSQFPIKTRQITLPFIETEERAEQVRNRINQSESETGLQPLVFYSMVIPQVKKIIQSSNALLYDVLSVLVESLKQDLKIEPQPEAQMSHSINKDAAGYQDRIAAIEYSLAHDDGISLNNLSQADLILLGVSRCGKTPTCLYLAMQFGVRAVNYPFIAEDMTNLRLPPAIEPYRFKTFGLTIDTDRLVAIRHERYANSDYASLNQCKSEIQKLERMYRREAIAYLNTTSLSVEEIATRLLDMSGLKRKMC